MKIVVVASGDFFSDYGGGQVYVRNIVNELMQHSEVNLFVISYCNNLNKEIREYNGIKVFQVNDETSFHNALSEIKPDIVHANGEKLLAAHLCKELNIPCVITVHHGGLVCPAGTLLNTKDEICCIPADFKHCLKCYLRHTPTGQFWYPLLKHFSQQRLICVGKRLKRIPFIPFLSPIGETGLIVNQKLQDWQEISKTATRFISPSNAMAEAMKRNGCNETKITVIPHGIPIDTLCDSENTERNTLPNDFPPLLFYYVGRINYVKGVHVLLKAFSSIDNSNIELHLIGGAVTNAEKRYMKRLQRKYNNDKRIVWHGKLSSDEMTESVKNYHCLIHPAIYLEVFGLNISEALAQHKYVIATRCGGPEMQIHSEKDGILVNPNNVESLSTAIKKYIEQPQKSNIIARNIQEHVKDLMNLYEKQINV